MKNKIKIFSLKEGYSVDLIVKEDDHELINVSKKFIEEIEKEYKKYKEKLSKEEKEFEKYKNHKKVYFSKEKLLKKSPLTILNAPWGSGKTFFIESFAKHFINKEIKANEFEKVIILDAWKYSNSKDIPYEIILELFYILVEKNNNKKLEKGLEKLSKYLLKPIIISWIDYLIKTDFKRIKKSKEINIDKLFINISKNIKPTLIMIDNIERIGKYSWEVIKGIFRISQIDNLCFVLPMNINILDGNKKSNEYPIEKYIDLPIFEFKQDYLSFLKKNKIAEEEAILINSILNKEINGQKLSIREAEQRFNRNDIFKEENKYLKINKIINKIWKTYETKNIAENYFLNNEDISKLFSYLQKLYKIYTEFKNELIEKKEIWNIDFKLDNLLEFFKNNNNKENNINYLDLIKKYEEITINIIKYEEIIKAEMKDQIKEKKKREKKNEKIYEELDKIQDEIEKVKDWKSSHNKDSHLNILEISRNEIHEKNKKSNEEIKILRIKIEKYENFLNALKDNLMISSLKDKKIEFEKIWSDLNENIDKYLKKEYFKWEKKPKFYISNLDNFKREFIDKLLT